jgi:hypothetical protein
MVISATSRYSAASLRVKGVSLISLNTSSCERFEKPDRFPIL